jgi:hypothetical protein
MSTTADLMGLGMPAALAGRIGYTPASVSGAGTSQSAGTVLYGEALWLATPTSSATAFTLSNAISSGRPVYFWNQSATYTALVFPPTGGTINNGSANASVSIPPLSGAEFQLGNGAGSTAENWGCIYGGTAAFTLTPNLTTLTLTGSSANIIAAGPNGTTTPVFNVDASTSSAVAGLNVKGAATGGTVAISTTDSGNNNNLSINAKGSGTIAIGNVSTGATTISNGLVVGAGSATITPLTLTSGTVNTTAVAGAVEYDGKVFYATNVASSRAAITTDQFIYAQAAITLTSQTGVQPIFLGTSGGVLTNGYLTLPVGTFEFECLVALSSMSGSSGSFGFALGTANSAVIGQQLWEAYAYKGGTLTTAGTLQITVNTTANTALATASTTTTGWFRIRGFFTVTTPGSIIPQISLGVSAAASVNVGSFFRLRPLGTQTITYVGDWS